jgi:hypothetical protein
MTQRERHTPDGGAHPSPPCVSQTAPPSPTAAGWEDWFRRAAPEQQRDLLALALRQGILYASQLPVPSPRTRIASDGSPLLLSSLLNGQAPAEPLRAPDIRVEDRALDSVQRQAVARALASPDLCLIQGIPGTGKSRVIAEVIRQATRRGERVLLLAPTAPALDRVLEGLGSRDPLCPLRLLAADEPPESLPACVRRLTVAERLRSFQEHTLPAARAALDEARKTRTRRQAQAETWARLEELAVRHEERAARLRQIRERRARMAALVEAELDRAAAEDAPAGFRAEWVACLGRRDEARKHLVERLAVLEEDIRKQEAELRQVEADLAAVGPLAEALRGGRWWTGTWWRAIFRRGQVRSRCADLERTRDERRAALAKVEHEREAALAEQEEADRLLEADRQRLIETEAARRRAACDAEAAELTAEQERVCREWARLVSALSLEGFEGDKETRRQGDKEMEGAPCLPVSLSPCPPAEVAAGREARARQREQDAQREGLARQWAEAVEEAAAKLPEYLACCANVVAATTAALAADPLFGNAAAAVFDLLVLDEAHHVTESEATAAAQRARRCVLVGEPPLGEESWGVRREALGEKKRMPHTPRPTPNALRPNFFGRLWQQLHAEPRRLGYAWLRRGDRLVCSLRPIAPDQERQLETETVADRPDVELRILVPPRPIRRGAGPAEAPRLAEVTFPAETPIEEAKAFIFRELQELPVQTPGRSLRWIEEPERVVCELAARPPAGLVAVHLDEGIREMVSPETGNTAALEFDRGVGWTLERAEHWVAEHLGLRDLGRTTRLATSYRAAPALARFLSDVLFDGLEERQGDKETGRQGEAAVEFVAVPPLPQEDKETRRGGDKETPRGSPSSPGLLVSVSPCLASRPRLRGVKGGAGLEVDLADPRRPLEPLPPEVRAVLPHRGLVNYLEARAVVRRLEALLADADFQAAGLDWQRQPPAPGDPAAAEGDPPTNGRGGAAIYRPAVAVMALSPAQVELVRWLVSRVPGLVEGPLMVEVGLPAEFRQRECLAALVSLTRSHTHRAASYGEGPHNLVEAFTRPASRLILFGDPATLVRRSQWQGPLDHLDEAAARAERDLVTRLVAYLQGHGAHPQVFRLLEGSPS